MEKLLLLLVISIVYFLLLTILILYHPYREKIYKNQNSIEYKILRELKETNKIQKEILYLR